jgi:hypothetical protein
MSIDFNTNVTPLLSTKGQILTSNGTTTAIFSAGANGYALSPLSSETTGLTWSIAAVGDSSSFSLISSNVLTASAASVEFSSITSGYRHLHLIVQGSSATTSRGILIDFNTDTAASNAKYYAGIISYANLSAGTYTNRFAQDSIDHPYAINSSTVTNGTLGSFEMMILQYKELVEHFMHGNAFSYNGTASDVFITPRFTAQYRNAVAIDKIRLRPSSGSFASGSRFFLYGYN